jgi:hypothetical protein
VENVQILGQSYTYWMGLKRDFLIYFPIEAGNIFSPERTPKDIRKQNSTGQSRPRQVALEYEAGTRGARSPVRLSEIVLSEVVLSLCELGVIFVTPQSSLTH